MNIITGDGTAEKINEQKMERPDWRKQFFGGAVGLQKYRIK